MGVETGEFGVRSEIGTGAWGGLAIRGWRYESGAVKAGRLSGLRIGRVWERGESRVLSK